MSAAGSAGFVGRPSQVGCGSFLRSIISRGTFGRGTSAFGLWSSAVVLGVGGDVTPPDELSYGTWEQDTTAQATNNS